MYFRFGAAVVLAVLVAVSGIAIEKRCLMLRRALSRDRYRYEGLCDLYARQRLQTQQLGAPARLLEALESSDKPIIARSHSARETSRGPQIAVESGVDARR
jgi:hypothetical protein